MSSQPPLCYLCGLPVRGLWFQSSAFPREVLEEHVFSKPFQREVFLGRMQRPSPAFSVHINPVGAMPKKNKLGKWRLIVDLSSPEKGSINDDISTECSSVS